MTVLRFVLRYGYIPAMLIGLLWTAITLVENDQSKWFLGTLLLGGILASFIVERLIPYEDDWNEPHKDAGRDVMHFIVNESSNLVSVLALPLVATLIPWTGIWPNEWPLWQQVLLAVIVADFGLTIAHYFSHRWNWLWRFHAVHHSVKRMYGFNGLMKHPIHQGIELLAGTTPLVLAGMPQDVAFLLAFAIAVQLLLQHSNADVRIGPFRYLLALSPVHRFHHIKWPVEGDVNFGLFTTVWDRFLGTAYYDPARLFTSEDLGIGSEPTYPNGYLAQLARPFRRQKAASGVLAEEG